MRTPLRMTEDRLPGPSREPTLMRRMAPWLLTIPSAIIGVLLVELFCWLFVPSISNALDQGFGTKRIFFFAGRDTIFQNHEDIFTFVPDSEIENLAAFLTDDGFTVEYAYHFHTNNLGLVQDADVVPGRDSLMLLGDSFTEGQGAEPWFRAVSPEIDKLGYQAINGGLRGTGFEQWLKLDRYLAAQNVQIRKLVVLFISDDYHRPVWNFDANDLLCLSQHPLCRNLETAVFRLPPPEELSSSIAKIRTARAAMRQRSWLGAHAAALLPASYHVYQYFTRRLRNPTFFARLENAGQQSRAAITEFISKYGPDNVAFIHLPQKDEIDRPNDLGLQARGYIQGAGGRLFDGFKLCGL